MDFQDITDNPEFDPLGELVKLLTPPNYTLRDPRSKHRIKKALYEIPILPNLDGSMPAGHVIVISAVHGALGVTKTGTGSEPFTVQVTPHGHDRSILVKSPPGGESLSDSDRGHGTSNLLGPLQLTTMRSDGSKPSELFFTRSSMNAVPNIMLTGATLIPAKTGMRVTQRDYGREDMCAEQHPLLSFTMAIRMVAGTPKTIKFYRLTGTPRAGIKIRGAKEAHVQGMGVGEEEYSTEKLLNILSNHAEFKDDSQELWTANCSSLNARPNDMPYYLYGLMINYIIQASIMSFVTLFGIEQRPVNFKMINRILPPDAAGLPDLYSQAASAPEDEFFVELHSLPQTLPDRKELHHLVDPVKKKIIQLMKFAHEKDYGNWKKSITDLFNDYIYPGDIFKETGPSVNKARQKVRQKAREKAMLEIQQLRSSEITCIQDISQVTSFDPATFYDVLSSMNDSSQHMILSLVAKHRFQLPIPPPSYMLKGLVEESLRAKDEAEALEPPIYDLEEADSSAGSKSLAFKMGAPAPVAAVVPAEMDADFVAGPAEMSPPVAAVVSAEMDAEPAAGPAETSPPVAAAVPERMDADMPAVVLGSAMPPTVPDLTLPPAARLPAQQKSTGPMRRRDKKRSGKTPAKSSTPGGGGRKTRKRIKRKKTKKRRKQKRQTKKRRRRRRSRK